MGGDPVDCGEAGSTAETLRRWVRGTERKAGERPGMTTDERERLKALEGENRELWRANEILRKASVDSMGQRTSAAKRAADVVVAFIDAHREAHGVEPIRAVLPIAPSTYFAVKAQQRAPAARCTRAKEDERLESALQRVHTTHHGVYGARKVSWQLRRNGERVAQCAVARLMRRVGLTGVVRGKRVRTTVSAATAPRPGDRLQRRFVAERPTQLWVAYFTYVATWRGMTCVAFVSDVFSRRIVG